MDPKSGATEKKCTDRRWRKGVPTVVAAVLAISPYPSITARCISTGAVERHHAPAIRHPCIRTIHDYSTAYTQRARV